MMFLGQVGLARLRWRIRHDEWAGRAAQQLLAAANPMLDGPSVSHALDQRNILLPVARDLARRVQTLGLAWFMTADSRYRARLVEELIAAASFPDWNRKHFIDTAEIMAAVGMGREWMNSFLTGRQRDAIDRALVEHGLVPARESLLLPSPWVRAVNNWTIICSAGSLVAALALRQSNPALSRQVVDLAKTVLARGLGAYEPDGGFAEGPTYWAYATDHAALAVAALEQMETPRFNAPQGLAATWSFGKAMTAPSGQFFDYGDSIPTPDRCHALGWLARRCADAEAAAWQRQAPGDPRPFDLIWCADQTETLPVQAPAFQTFIAAGVSVFRDANLYFALKGGANATNHAHLDLGSFILEVDGHRFVGDLGREDYSLPGYFSPQTRFEYFRTTTRAHNTLVFEGGNQAVTAKAIWLDPCLGMEQLSVAYRIEDKSAPCHLLRAAAALPGHGIVIVDRIRPRGDTPASADWRIHTSAEVEASGDRAMLMLGGRSLDLRVEGLPGSALEVEPAETPPGESGNSEFTRLIHRFMVDREPVEIASFFLASPSHEPRLRQMARRLHNWLVSVDQ
jgi:hypothetical protein